MNSPFNGLFRRETRHATRTFDHGFRWDFHAPDLNDSARALFLQLDRIFEALKTPDHVFLASIELEAESGRFPEVLVQYFRDEAWSDTQSYFVAPIKRTGTRSMYATGRLTFEAAPGQLVRVLAQNGGFRWGSASRVWGVQVPASNIADLIEMSLEDPNCLRRAEPAARVAWIADDDLDSLALWLSSSVDRETRDRLAKLK